MYKLEYLPAARQDMVDIVRYISRELSNPTAAERLTMELIQAGDSIPGFPYVNSAYTPIRPLKCEYRKRLVQNFYWVDEGRKLVTVARVIYAKREIDRLLE